MRVSVVVPTWNSTWCIERALGSVLCQSRPADEVLVCDDGSTDGTAELVERRFGGAVTVLRLPHRNASQARHSGVERSRGDWLAFLDADDRWWPDKLERQVAFLGRHPEVRWLTADGRYVQDGTVVRESWLSDYFAPLRDVTGDLLGPLLERCFPLLSAALVAREAYDAVGGFDPALAASHDYDLWLRLAARYPGAVMAEPLADYLVGPASLSRDLGLRHRDDLAIMRRVAGDGLGRGREVRRVAAERAAALEFELALLAVRGGRVGEARGRLWRAAGRGPWRRRVVALGGALLPARALGPLTRSPLLKRAVRSGRRVAGPLALPDGDGGARVSAPFDAAVVIPSRDGMPHVLAAVESALAQTRPPAEVIVVDDGSADGTHAAVAGRFGQDRRAPVRVLRGDFGGAAAARNAGWRAAAAPWIALLDADDVWLPEKLERAAAAVARAPAATWFFSDGSFGTLEGEVHPSTFALYADVPEAYVGSPVAELFEVNFVLTSSVVVRRDVLERLGGFDETLSHTEDLELWIRLARDGPAAASRLVLLHYRPRPEGLSQQVENRLLGDVELFGRLAADAALTPGLRRAARRRRALARYKLAVTALRAGDASGARRHLQGSWLFPERVLPVVATGLASRLPPRALLALRRWGWATRWLGSRFVSPRRVRLAGPASGAP